MPIQIIGAGSFETPAQAVADADARRARRVYIGAPMTPTDAVLLCKFLPPPARPFDSLYPIGWGLFPPQGMPPAGLPLPVEMKQDFRDINGEPVPAGHEAILHCMWNSPLDRPIGRFVLTAYTGAKVPRVMDGYLDEAVLHWKRFEGQPFKRAGWELSRLDPEEPTEFFHATT